MLLGESDRAGHFVSDRLPVPDLLPTPFIALSAYVTREQALGKLAYRYYDKGAWSEWLALPEFGEGGVVGRMVFDVQFIDESVEFVQVRSDVRIYGELVVRLYYPGNSAGTSESSPSYRSMVCPCPQPGYCNRSCWDPGNDCPADPTPAFTTPTHMIVHHSAGQTTSSDFPAAVRSYWDLHVNTNGWDDIGYNWLIDGNGVLYEGRGDGVLGAHFSCMNSGTMGVCVIGNYQTNIPTSAALGKLYDLLAWEACDKGITIPGSSFHAGSSQTLNHISGHRDANNSTDPDGCPDGTVCPGDNIYTQLAAIRTAVAAEIAACGGGCGQPSNDGCSGSFSATILPFGSSCNPTPSTSCGATSSGFSSCTGTQDDDVFFRFVPTSSSATITVAPSTGYNAVVQVLTGPCGGGMSELACVNNTGTGGTETVTVTGLTSGTTYFVRVWHSSTGSGTTGNFTICAYNNSSSEDITVSGQQLSSSSVEAGGSITASADHNYTGSQLDANLPSFDLAYLLSTNCSLDGSDVYLGGDVSGLGSDDPTNSESEALTIPAGTSPGTYYVLFVADYNNELSEGSGEGNNVQCVQLTVTPPPGGEDITVTNTTLSAASVAAGGTVTASADHNYAGSQLDADLPSFDLGYLLSTNCALDGGDLLLDTDASGLGVDDPTNAESQGLTIPSGTSPGNYFILFVADYADELAEGAGESNNVQCVTITVQEACTVPAVPTPTFGSNSCPGPSLSSTITLQWNPVPGAAGYRLRVGLYPYNTNDYIDVGAGDCFPGTSYSIPLATFTTGVPLFWSVSAIGECGNDACLSAYSTPRYFSVLPVVLVSNGTTICDEESADLYINPLWFVTPPGLNSAQWYRDGILIPGATAANYSATQEGEYSIALTFTGSGVCTDPVVLGSSNAVQIVELNGDTDGDGVPNCADNCPYVSGHIGSPCNDGNPNTTDDLINASCVCEGTIAAVQLSARVFLEGAYVPASGLMNDALRSLGSYPLTEPYTALGYVHNGGGGETVQTSVLAIAGQNAVTDWVLLELRSSANPSQIIATRSALLQRDGDVVATDGISPVSFTASPGSYYVAVRHRNHLGVMTNWTVGLNGSPTVVDFTAQATDTWGTNARKTLTGAFPAEVLWAGDVTFNGQVQYIGSGNDRDPILVTVGSTTPNNTVNAYTTRDVNLNGQVKYTGTENDRDPILLTVGSTTPTTIRVQQLP